VRNLLPVGFTTKICLGGFVSERSKLWVLATAGLVFAQSVASLLLRTDNFQLSVLSDITQCILLLSGTAALLPNAVRSHGRNRLFWMLMVLGLLLWLSYQLLWTYYEVVLDKGVPDPFAGDIILFLHIVPMMAALAMQPHLQQDERASRLGTLDFALLLVWWVYLYFVTVLPWEYAVTNEQEYSRSLNVLYLTEKMVFLSGLALAGLRSRDSWRRIYAHWFGASLMYSLSSYIAIWAIAKHVYYTGSLYDIPLAVSMAWVTVIGLMARDSELKQQATSFSTTRGVRVARLGMIAIFTLPLFAAWSLFDTKSPIPVRDFRLIVTLIAMTVMGGMVFLRQHLLDREHVRLLRNSEEEFEDLRLLQTELVKSEKLASLGQLVQGAAHELNNPLTAMLGYSDLLTTTPMSAEQMEVAQKIAQQTRRTRALVSSLLSFARQVPFEKVRLEVNSLVQTALKLSQPVLEARKIDTVLKTTADLPKVWADSNQLLQVCLQIINNASYAMEDAGGGLLTVSTRLGDDSVVVEFADNGPGAQDPQRVFDPLYASQPGGHGRGVGLGACHGIIQEHRGRIWFQNGPDRGAIFRIELPAADPISHVGRASDRAAHDEPHAAATLPLHPAPQ
jgi:signal transduction histidine kinase